MAEGLKDWELLVEEAIIFKHLSQVTLDKSFVDETE